MTDINPPGMIDEEDASDKQGPILRSARKTNRASVAAFLEQTANKTYASTEDMFEDLATSIVDESKRAEAEKKRAGYWKKMSAAMAIGAVVFFGIMFGVMFASNEMSKESHITAADGPAGNTIVAGAIAKEDIPLKYLPVMDLGTISQTIGQSIMYKKGVDTVYELITAVSKPQDGSLSVTITTQSGVKLTVNSDAATVTFDTPDGPVTERLWGSVSCAKLKLDARDVLEAKLLEEVGEEGMRRLEVAEMLASSEQHHARRLGVMDRRARKLASFYNAGIKSMDDDACFEYWQGNFFRWRDWNNEECRDEDMGPWVNIMAYRPYFPRLDAAFPNNALVPDDWVCLDFCSPKELERDSTIAWSDTGKKMCKKKEKCENVK